MPTEPFHFDGQHERVCPYCQETFLAKRTNTIACYKEQCRKRLRNDAARKRYARKKGGDNE